MVLGLELGPRLHQPWPSSWFCNSPRGCLLEVVLAWSYDKAHAASEMVKYGLAWSYDKAHEASEMVTYGLAWSYDKAHEASEMVKYGLYG